jgi:hypothetical protein
MGLEIAHSRAAVSAIALDTLFEAYQASLERYRDTTGESFPTAEVRLAMVSAMIAEADRGVLDTQRLSAVGLLAVGIETDLA